MKIHITPLQAVAQLLSDSGASWSYDGAIALSEHLEELEADCGEEIYFDPVALRCEYSEHKSLVDWAQDYGADLGEAPEDEEERDEEIREYIRDHGTLIEFDGGVIVSSF